MRSNQKSWVDKKILLFDTTIKELMEEGTIETLDDVRGLIKQIAPTNIHGLGIPITKTLIGSRAALNRLQSSYKSIKIIPLMLFSSPEDARKQLNLFFLGKNYNPSGKKLVATPPPFDLEEKEEEIKSLAFNYPDWYKDKDFSRLFEIIRFIRSNNIKAYLYVDFTMPMHRRVEHLCDALREMAGGELTREKMQGNLCIPNVLGLSDIHGKARTFEFREFIRNIRDLLGELYLFVRCHDSYGLGISNTFAAIDSGVDGVSCSFLGIGKKSPVTAFEQVVTTLQDCYDMDHGITTQRLTIIANYIATVKGIRIPFNQPMVGEDTTTHSTGGHFVAAERAKAYEYGDPGKYGREFEFAVNLYSGFKNIRAALTEKKFTPQNVSLGRLIGDLILYVKHDIRQSYTKHDIFELAQARDRVQDWIIRLEPEIKGKTIGKLKVPDDTRNDEDFARYILNLHVIDKFLKSQIEKTVGRKGGRTPNQKEIYNYFAEYNHKRATNMGRNPPPPKLLPVR